VLKLGKSYKKEYKEYVAKLVVEEGKKLTQLSYELDIPYNTMSTWVREYKKQTSMSPEELKLYQTPSELKKLDEAKDKRIRELEEENEILKKAMHIFSKSQ